MLASLKFKFIILTLRVASRTPRTTFHKLPIRRFSTCRLPYVTPTPFRTLHRLHHVQVSTSSYAGHHKNIPRFHSATRPSNSSRCTAELRDSIARTLPHTLKFGPDFLYVLYNLKFLLCIHYWPITSNPFTTFRGPFNFCSHPFLVNFCIMCARLRCICVSL